MQQFDTGCSLSRKSIKWIDFKESCSVELVIYHFFFTFQQIGQWIIPTTTWNTSIRTIFIIRFYRRIILHHAQHDVLTQNISAIGLSIRTFAVGIHRSTGFNEIVNGLIYIHTS